MKVAIKEPQKDIVFKDIENDLSTIQSIVNGYIETLSFDRYIMIMNEEGKNEILPLNFYIPALNDCILGTVIFAERDGGEFSDIVDEKHFLGEFEKILK